MTGRGFKCVLNRNLKSKVIMNQVELSPRMELNQRAKNAGYLLDSQTYYLLKKDHDIILCKDLLEVSQFLNQLESDQVP